MPSVQQGELGWVKQLLMGFAEATAREPVVDEERAHPQGRPVRQLRPGRLGAMNPRMAITPITICWAGGHQAVKHEGRRFGSGAGHWDKRPAAMSQIMSTIAWSCVTAV